MSQFKVGDNVVRLAEHRDDTWRRACAARNLPYDFVGTVESCDDYTIKLVEITEPNLEAAWWNAPYFTYVTATTASVDALASEVARCCGTVADKEEMQRLVAALERDLDTRQNQLDVVMKRNNALSDQIKAANDQRDAAVAAAQTQAAEIQRLQQQVAAFQADVGDAIDLAEAARHTARTLGNEVQELRMERREYRHALASFKGPIAELRAGVEDIDTGTLSSQLDQIGRMADEQGNGADAKLCFDASQVLDMVERFLSNYDAE